MYKLYVGNFSSDSGFHIITLNNHFDIIIDKVILHQITTHICIVIAVI